MLRGRRKAGAVRGVGDILVDVLAPAYSPSNRFGLTKALEGQLIGVYGKRHLFSEKLIDLVRAAHHAENCAEGKMEAIF